MRLGLGLRLGLGSGLRLGFARGADPQPRQQQPPAEQAEQGPRTATRRVLRPTRCEWPVREHADLREQWQAQRREAGLQC